MVKLNVGTYIIDYMDPVGKLKTYKRLDTLNLFFSKALYNYIFEEFGSKQPKHQM